MKLTAKLPGSLWGYKVVFMTVVATAIINFGLLAHSMVSHYQIVREVYPTSTSDDAPLLMKLEWAWTLHGEALLLITLPLIFSAVGLWSRRVFGFVLSLIALLCLVLVYVQWYRLTLRAMEMTGFKDFSEMGSAAISASTEWGDLVGPRSPRHRDSGFHLADCDA